MSSYRSAFKRKFDATKDAANITSGTLALGRIPAIDAARVPSLDASKITTGALNAARVPSLDASKIATGTLNVARVPSLDASKITSGALNAARVPSLDASKITTGTLNTARVPDPSTGQVLSAIAGATVGAIGTYAMLKNTRSDIYNPGDTGPGSDFFYTSAEAYRTTNPAGSWLCVGYAINSSNLSSEVSVFLRVS